MEERNDAALVDDVAAGVLREEIEKAMKEKNKVDDETLEAINAKLGEAVLAELEKDEIKHTVENQARAAAPGIVDIVMDKLASMRHILLGTLAAYYLGHWGFHMFWVLFLFYYVYAADAKYKLRGFTHFYKMKKMKGERKKQAEEGEDSGTWFNHLMAALWPNISDFAALEMKRFMAVAIHEALDESRPPVVQEVYVRSISLGRVPPEIHLLKTKRFPENPNLIQIDLTLAYEGELAITVVAKLGTGAVMTKLPIELRDVKVKAPMQFVVEFLPESPFLKTLDVAFRTVPTDWLSFNVKLLGAVNVLSAPTIQSWVFDTITQAVRDTMELPNKIHVPMVPEDDEHAEDSSKSKKRQLLVLKQGERNPFVQYRGHIKVKLLHAKSLLQTDAFGTTDAYVKLYLNDVWYRSQTVCNSLDPEFNEYFEFPLEADDEDQRLLVKVKDWDPSGKNDVQGKAEIFVSTLPKDEPQEITAFLQHPEKVIKGTVQLVVTYCPDTNLDFKYEE